MEGNVAFLVDYETPPVCWSASSLDPRLQDPSSEFALYQTGKMLFQKMGLELPLLEEAL